MKNKWTTLIEDQTEKASNAISEILDGHSAGTRASRRNKTIAVAMAGVGVLLIAVGMYPFLQGLRGDITGIDDVNIFATPVDTVDDVLPGNSEERILPVDPNALTPPTDEQLGDNLANAEKPQEIAEKTPPVETKPLESTKTGTPQDTTPVSAVPEQKPEVTAVEIPVAAPLPVENSAPVLPAPVAFARNTHTGTVDPNVMVFGQTSEQKVTSEQKEVLHAAAPEGKKNVQSGPAEWFAIGIALLGTVVLRRKKLFA